MRTDSRPVLATLGGPATFAGQATDAYLSTSGADVEVAYRSSVPELWEALDTGAVSGLMLAAATEHTGWSKTAERVLARPGDYAILAETVVPYRCVLVGRSGADLSAIREIRGHGSLRECAAYFSRETPSARLLVHQGNSSAALAEVEQLDATVAVVTTRAAAAQTTLETLAEDVDGGSRGSWWLVTRGPAELVADPDTVVVVVPNHSLTAAVLLMWDRGLRVRDAMSMPADQLFTSTHLVVADRVTGSGGIAPGELAELGGVLLGAFHTTAEPLLSIPGGASRP